MIRTPTRSSSCGTLNIHEASEDSLAAREKERVGSDKAMTSNTFSVIGSKNSNVTWPLIVLSDKLDILVDIDERSPCRKNRGILGVTISSFWETVNASAVPLFSSLSCANMRNRQRVLLSGTVNAITVSPLSLVRKLG